MALSQQLRAIANQARGSVDQTAKAGQAAVGAEAGQALAQTATTAPQGKAVSQQLAGGITAAQQGVEVKAAGDEQQILGQLGQQGLQQAGQAKQQKLGEQQLINDTQIEELQRQGQLRQNSAALKQTKQLQAQELAMQNRLVSGQMEYDGSLSFLTRKQRTDLASMGEYAKNMIFDQRLTFQKSEGERQFSNMRQLADYAMLTRQDDSIMQSQMREMEQSTMREITALQSAHSMIVSKLEMEFKRAEKTKDYALLRKLQEAKNALDAKIRRKAAQGAMTSNIIIGAATIIGAVAAGSVTGGMGAGQGAAVGYSVGQGLAGAKAANET